MRRVNRKICGREAKEDKSRTYLRSEHSDESSGGGGGSGLGERAARGASLDVSLVSASVSCSDCAP